MYFPELRRLREANPDLGDAIDQLDRYLSSLDASARSHINASTVSAAIAIPRDKAIGLLMAAAELGLLKLKFRVQCPEGHGLRDFDKLQDIPKELYCDVCDESRPVSPDDIEYFFTLTERATSVRR
jgi:hypothetical protein